MKKELNMKQTLIGMLGALVLVLGCGEDGGGTVFGGNKETVASMPMYSPGYWEEVRTPIGEAAEGEEQEFTISYPKVDTLPSDEPVNLVVGGEVVYTEVDGGRNYYLAPGIIGGKEYLVDVSYILPGQSLGVVVDETPLPLKAGGVDSDQITEFSLPRMTLVGILDDGVDSDYYRVLARVVEQPDGKIVNFGQWNTWYVKRSGISTSQVDIDLAAQISSIKSKEETASENRQRLMLEDALNKYRTSVFVKELEEMLLELRGGAADEAPVEEEVEFTWEEEEMTERPYDVFGGTLNVRSKPTVDSDPVGTLEDGATILVTKKTKEQYDLGGNSDYWYYSPEAGGWVFGAFIRLSESFLDGPPPGL
jgi:hypothetical protein